jgi:hypothetical protein
MFNATFNNISVISWRSILWWRKPEFPENTNGLSQVTVKLYRVMIYISIMVMRNMAVLNRTI